MHNLLLGELRSQAHHPPQIWLLLSSSVIEFCVFGIVDGGGIAMMEAAAVVAVVVGNT